MLVPAVRELSPEHRQTEAFAEGREQQNDASDPAFSAKAYTYF